MAKPLRIVLASIGVLLALEAVVLATEQVTLTYYLPPTPDGHPNSHTTTFGPGVAATVVAVLVVLIMIGWLIINIVRASKLWLWAVPLATLIISYVVAIVVMGLDRPAF